MTFPVYLSHLTIIWPIQPPEPKVCQILMATPSRLVPRCCSHILHIFGALLSELVHHNCGLLAKNPAVVFSRFSRRGPFCKNASYSNRRSQNQHILEVFFNRPLQGFCPISRETSMDGTQVLDSAPPPKSSNLLGTRSGFVGELMTLC